MYIEMQVIQHHIKRLLFSGAIILLSLLNFNFITYAATLTWNGGGGDTLASNSANWIGGVIPQNGDDVVFSAESVKNCTWDRDITLASFSMNLDAAT